MEDGVIKYSIRWTDTSCISETEIQAMSHFRKILWQHQLIGEDAQGIGFGNISRRDTENPDHFIISGTQTGKHEWLTADQYSKVTYFNIKNNIVFCKGKIKASSEALAHGNLYANIPNCQIVIHIHSSNLWQKYYNVLPTTNEKIVYGTPKMAETVQFLFKESSTQIDDNKILIMGGHQDGILGYDANFEPLIKKILSL